MLTNIYFSLLYLYPAAIKRLNSIQFPNIITLHNGHTPFVQKINYIHVFTHSRNNRFVLIKKRH